MTDHLPPPPPPADQPAKKPIWKRRWVWAAAVVVLIIGIAASQGSEKADQTAAAGQETAERWTSCVAGHVGGRSGWTRSGAC